MSEADWKNMTSAPKDGTPLLLGRCEDTPYLVVGYWCDKGYEPGLCWKVVGGRELPAPPQAWDHLPALFAREPRP